MGMHRSEGSTALLGMDGFVAGAAVEVDGEWWLAVETMRLQWAARPAAAEQSVTADGRSGSGTCPSPIAAWCSYGASACGVVPTPTAR